MTVAGCAQLASLARNGRVDGHALTRAWSSFDDAGYLMSQDQRPCQERVADAPLEEPMPVRPAQADGRDANKLLARRWSRVGLVMQPKIGRGVQPGDLHPTNGTESAVIV